MLKNTFAGIEFYNGGAYIAIVKNDIIPKISVLKNIKNDDTDLLYKKVELFLKKFPDAFISVVADDKSVLIRSLKIKAASDEELEDSLPFQAEPILPFTLENGALDYQQLDCNDEYREITVFAAPKNNIKEQWKLLKKHQIHCEEISSKSSSIVAGNTFISSNEESFCSLWIGLNRSLLIFSQSNLVRKSLSISMGAENFIDNDNIEKFILDISKNIAALEQQYSLKEKSLLLICGDTANISSKLDLIKSKINLEPTIVHSNEIEDVQQFSIAIGVALNAMQTDQHKKVNFLRGELAPSFSWNRHKSFFIPYFIVITMIALSLFFLSNSIIYKKTHQLKKQYLNFIHQYYNYNYIKKVDLNQKEVLSIINNEIEILKKKPLYHISNKINEINESVDKSFIFFNFIPSVPRVSDCLIWLSNHPAIYDKNKKESLMNIESFSYKLVKFPAIGKEKEIYEAKIDISFSASSSRAARDLHQQLLDETIFIDKKKEIKWVASDNLYKASFFLKNKGSA